MVNSEQRFILSGFGDLSSCQSIYRHPEVSRQGCARANKPINSDGHRLLLISSSAGVSSSGREIELVEQHFIQHASMLGVERPTGPLKLISLDRLMLAER
jgi:hypothetical protein